MSVSPTLATPKAWPAFKNDDPTGIAVYDFNIHQMGDDWEAWIQRIKVSDIPMPDVLLLQDVEDGQDSKPVTATGGVCDKDPDGSKDDVEPGVESLKTKMDSELGARFKWRASRNFANNDCRNEAAIMWRSGRFDLVLNASGGERVRYGVGYGGPSCTKPDDGSPWLQVKLKDKISGKAMSAVSYKTSHKKTPDSCPWKNIELHNSNLTETGWSGDVVLMGTDANSRDYGNDNTTQYSCWFAKAVEENTEAPPNCDSPALANGYTDPIYYLCNQDWADRECFSGLNWTHGGDARIDFIFAKRPGATSPGIVIAQTETIEKGPAGCSKNTCYSDHRSIRTMVTY